MSVMTSKQLSTTIKAIKRGREKLQHAIQEALVSASFYAMKDGNVEPFNQLLDAVGNATRIKGLTMWAETFAPVIVRDGKFTLNKTAKKEISVETADDFAQFESEMRAGPTWYEIAGEQKAESIFDPSPYLGKVADKLEKKGFADLAKQLRAVKGAYEMDLITTVGAVEVVDAEEAPAPLQIAA